MQKLFFCRCIRFDNKHIVSGAYDGKIKVWDLQAALDPRKPSQALCIRTLMVGCLFAKRANLEIRNKDTRKPLYLFHKIPKTLIYPEAKYLFRVDNK